MAISRYDAQITFKDVTGIEAKTVLNKIPIAAAPDLAKLLTAATGIQSLSNAGIKAYSLLGWDSAAFAGSATPAGLNTIKAAISLQYYIGGVLNTRLMFIPNPGQTIIEEVEGQGTRVTAAALTAITGAMTAAAGFAVTAVEGKIVVQGGKRASKASGSSIGFRDVANNTTYMGIPAPLITTAAALTTLATALQTAVVSASKIVSTKHLTILEASPDQTVGVGLAIVDATDALFSSVERRLHLQYVYATSNVRHFLSHIIPAPSSDELVVSGRSYRLARASGVLLAETLTTFLGNTRTLTFVGSKLHGYDVLER
jgi:hypothetical protein